jgi:MFS family permease
MMGIYYAAPLLGPSIGPLFGGILSQVWSWRATFYFLTIIGGVVLLSLFLFKDTWRRERSLTYQSAKRHAIHRAEEKERNRVAKLTNVAERAGSQKDQAVDTDTEKGHVDSDYELAEVDPSSVKVTLVDLNPFKPIWSVLKRKNNLAILIPSGKKYLSRSGLPCYSVSVTDTFLFSYVWSTLCTALLFALQYSVCYTAARTFAASPYNYNPLKIGLVLLSFGVGTYQPFFHPSLRPDLLQPFL